MYTLADAVREHAEKVKGKASTRDGVKFLELPDEYKFNSAGNIYLVALGIINEQKKEIERLNLLVNRTKGI